MKKYADMMMKTERLKKLPVVLMLFFSAFIILPMQAFSGDQTVDSLKKVINTSTIDTNYVKACIALAWEYMYTNADTAEIFAQKGLESAQKTTEPLLEANSLNTLGVTYIVRGNYFKALAVLKQGIEIVNVLLEREPDNYLYIRRILALYANTGNVHYYLGEYSTAIENYLEALRYSEQINFIPGKANCLSNIGASYKDMSDYPKALEYNYRSLALAKETGDEYLISQSLNNLGSIYFSVPDYDSAMHYFKLSMKRFLETNNEFELINSYVNMGNVYRNTNQYDSALIYLNKGLALSTKLSSVDGLINAHYMLGQLYDTTRQYPKAIKHFKQSIRLAEETGTNRFVMLGNEELSNVYFKTGDYKNAFRHLRAGNHIRDSIFNAEHDQRIAELETKFQTREKEEKIRLLSKQRALEKEQAKNRQLFLFTIITLLVLVLIIIFDAYRSHKNKRKIERIMLHRKAEKKVMSAVVSTEYKERKRFAEELHDSMGALLSTLKIYINELGDTSLTEKEKRQMLKQSNKLLDEAITSARNISHNIMPASIKDHGLEYSLRSFVKKINASGKIIIHLTTSLLNGRYDQILELSVYRMITELINNTLKHAGATEINISLVEKNNRLYITYKDNGKGFDYDDVISSDKNGLGLKNILSRIEIIEGRHTISSEKGKGFFAAIEVPV